MRKKILITLLILVLIVVGAGAYVFFNLNSLIASFKPQLEAIASDIAGSPVTFGKIEASLYPSVNIDVSDIAVKSSATSGENISLKEIKLAVELMPLLSKKIKVSKATIKELHVVAVKDGGKMRIPGVKAPEAQQAAAEKSVENPASLGENAAAPISIELDGFDLQDSSLTLDDRDAKKRLKVSELNLETSVKLEGDSVKLPALSVTGKLLGQLPFKVKAENLALGLKSGEASVPKLTVEALNTAFHVSGNFASKSKNGKFSLESPGIDLTEIKTLKIEEFQALLAKVTEFNPQGKAAPTVTVSLNNGAYDAKGKLAITSFAAVVAAKPVSELNGVINFEAVPESATLSATDLALKFNGAPITATFRANLTGKKLKLEELKAKAFGGATDIKVDVVLGEAPQFQVQLSTAELAIDPMMRVLSPTRESNMVGTVQKADLAVAGSVGPDLIQSLNGNVSYVVVNGALKNVNVAGDVLKGFKDLPLIGQAVLARVPEAYRNAINSADTEIKRLSGTAKIGDGALTTGDTQLLNPLFTLDARGRIAIAGPINLNTNIRFEKEFSQALVGSIKELRVVLDREGRIALPVAVSGIPPNISILPDVSKLLERGTQKFIEDKAGEFLEGVIKGQKGGRGGGLEKILGF